jgi:hypothetical protein
MYKQSYPVPPPTYFSQVSGPEPIIVHLTTGLSPIPVTAVAGRLLVIKFRMAVVTSGAPTVSGPCEGYIMVTDTSAVVTSGTFGGPMIGIGTTINGAGDLQIAPYGAYLAIPTAVWFEILEMTLYGVA